MKFVFQNDLLLMNRSHHPFLNHQDPHGQSMFFLEVQRRLHPPIYKNIDGLLILYFLDHLCDVKEAQNKWA